MRIAIVLGQCERGDKMSRLIDADELEKMLVAWIRDHWTDAFTGDDAGSEFADMIEHAETIDACKSNGACGDQDKKYKGE